MDFDKELFVEKTIVDIEDYITGNLGNGLIIKFSDGTSVKIESWNDFDASDLIVKPEKQ